MGLALQFDAKKTIGSPAAVINAILNALSDYNIDNLQMPATPERVWQAMQGNG